MTPVEAARILRALHPSRALEPHERAAVAVAVAVLEEMDRTERAEDDTRPIEIPPRGRLAERGLR